MASCQAGLVLLDLRKGQFVVLCILLSFFSRDGVEMLPGLITPTPERTNRRLTDVMVHSRKREHPRSKPELEVQQTERNRKEQVY